MPLLSPGDQFPSLFLSPPGQAAATGRLWDHVVGLAGFPGLAELKRSLRERRSCAASASIPARLPESEDWHGGSRRQKK
jgi:hypothetical protein